MSTIARKNERLLPETLVSLLEAHASAAPDSDAFIFLRDGRTEGAHLSYSDLDSRARALAAALQSTGVQPGERALLLFPAGVEVLVALFGCLYAGVVAVPVPAPEASRIARTLPRLKAIADDARATLLISCAQTLEDIASVPAARSAFASVRMLDVACVDDSIAPQWRPPAIGPESLAYLQYTSGSTSTPKGVCITHAHLLRHLDVLANHCGGYSAETVTVNWMPYFHDYGLVEGMLLPLYNRTLCVLMSPYALIKQPANWLRAISRYHATHSQAPNFAYAHCVKRVDPAVLGELDLTRWRCAGNAAEPINPDAMAAFAEMFEPAGFRYESFSPCYGLAEATLMVTYKAQGTEPRVGRFDREAMERGLVGPSAANALPKDVRDVVGCGVPLKGTVVVIVDPQTRERASADAIGEIWVSGPAVASGYWQREQATDETFGARLADTGEGPFLRTGDLGFFHEGELFVCGRHKDLIIIRGQNYSPHDIEWTVQEAHPALKPESGAAFSVEIDGEERLIVAQEVQGKLIRGLDEAAVFAAIGRAVGEEHGLEIHAIVLLRSGGISKTSSGKIQRGACRRMFLDGTLNAVATWWRPPGIGDAAIRPVPPGRPPEAAIRDFVVARVAAAIGQPAEAIDPREPFARLGLDSVRAVSLVGELEAWIGRELPATLAFDYPNPAALARHLGSGERGLPEGVSPKEGERQPIAIVGAGCRFPGGINGPGQYWEGLLAGFDGVQEVPRQRWDADAWYAPETGTPGKMNTRWGGFIGDVDAFDAGFFAMSPREAQFVDPQQRLLLEVSWEALENAGIAADTLAGSRTGVFIGICGNDYQRLQGAGASLQEGYAATGNALSIAANRISYTLDLLGPSLSVDTACSSSLVAVHQACRSLLAGESDLALAGGVNLVLDPAGTVSFSQSRMMSPTGRCRSFSDDADGYVRAEGCGVVVLKRLADATRAGDRIIAVIRGSAVNQDGRSNGLTAPSGPSQQAVVRAALADAAVAPSEVGYVETHGTGTPLGDPIEFNALAEVLGKGRAPEQRCWVGSVKSNIGHLEGAAGIAGLIKAALCVERGVVPRNLHFRSLNPHIRVEGSGLGVPTCTEPWPGEYGRRIAGVSSFGFGGTNAHVVVAAAPDARRPRGGVERPFHLVCASARSEEALKKLVSAYAQRLRAAPAEELGDLCFSINTGRSVFAYRAAAIGASGAELADALGSLEEGSASSSGPGAAFGKSTQKAPPLVFLFGDVGATEPAMGAELFGTSPVFAEAVERCLRCLDEETGNALRRRFSGAPAGFGEAPRALQALHVFALQYASWKLWRSWGIRATEVFGTGNGLLAAACATGVVTLDEALRLCTIGEGKDAAESLAAIALRAPDVAFNGAQGAAGTPLEAALLERVCGFDAREGARDGGSVWLEIGPRGAETGHGALPKSAQLPGLVAGRGEWRALMIALGRLFVAGVGADWKCLDASYGRQRVDAPTYPFQRRRYWFPQAGSEAGAGAHRALEESGSPGSRNQPAEGRSVPANGTAAHLDWLMSELGRLHPSKRRSVLERLLKEMRIGATPEPRNGDAPSSSAEIQGLSDEKAELEHPRLESPNLPAAIVDTNCGWHGRDMSMVKAAAISTGMATPSGLDARIDLDSTHPKSGNHVRRSFSENELETLSDDEVETLLRERLDQLKH